jgi:phosphotransacetylase
MRIRIGFCEKDDHRIQKAFKELGRRNFVDLSMIDIQETIPVDEKYTGVEYEQKITAYQEQAYVTGLNKLRDNQLDVLIAGADIALAQFLRYVFQIFSSKRDENLLFSVAPIYWKTNRRWFSLVDPCVVVDPSPEELAYMAHQSMRITEDLINEPLYACVLAHATAMENDKVELHRSAIRRLTELRTAAEVCSHPLQLDAAMSEDAARRKLGELPRMPNVLVCPDITSANLLYKSLEIFARDSVTLCGAILAGLPNGFIGLLPRTAQVEEIIKLADILTRIIRGLRLRG